jgi:magnesium transporter
VRVVNLTQSYQEILAGILSIHLSLASNKMNDVMKVLTIFTAVILPMTLITGIYGMNFENMPELHTHYGYFVVLGILVIIGIAMTLYFRLKRWF